MITLDEIEHLRETWDRTTMGSTFRYIENSPEYILFWYRINKHSPVLGDRNTVVLFTDAVMDLENWLSLPRKFSLTEKNDRAVFIAALIKKLDSYPKHSRIYHLEDEC